jgi:hypothetical protein
MGEGFDMDEWCLSNSIEFWRNEVEQGAILDVEDVKEFIRRLKENPILCFNSIMEEEIDKLAGDKLI